jgi:hypothetical protein
MKRHLRRTSVRVVLIVVSAFGAVLWTVDAVWSMQEPKEVAHMSKQMKTVCVGRFLIDVPADAQVTVNSAAVDGFDIVDYGIESQEAFMARVARREAEINAVKNLAGQKNMVSRQDVHAESVEGRIFVFGMNSGYLVEDGVKVVYANVAVDGYARVNERTVRFSATAYKPDDTANLARLFGQLRPRVAGAIPREAGFCLDGVFLRDPLTPDQGERIVMFAGLPGHDDLGIALSTIAGKAPGPGLLERNAANRAGAYAFLNPLTSTLLQGPRTINGMPGDELAFKARERNFSTGYAFDWETQGTAGDVLHPFVALELQTGISPRAGGEPVQSTLSEASVGDLWRRMSASLRLRPVEPPAAFEVDRQQGLALGTLAWAGEPCRQSGWWQCDQAQAGIGILGGERQFLRMGQIMPQALLLPRPNVWQKVRGVQPSFEAATPTGWRLADKRGTGRRPPAGLAQPGPGDGTRAAAHVSDGHVARSGDACPASGWWRCIDAQALDGARWFAHGATLPMATYCLPAGGMQRRLRHDHLVARPGGWQLMRPCGAPPVPHPSVEAAAAPA